MEVGKVDEPACKSALYYYGRACNYDEEWSAVPVFLSITWRHTFRLSLLCFSDSKTVCILALVQALSDYPGASDSILKDADTVNQNSQHMYRRACSNASIQTVLLSEKHSKDSLKVCCLQVMERHTGTALHSKVMERWNKGYHLQESKALGYEGPSVAARALAAMFPDNRKETVILDIGGGTGLVGEALKKEGFEIMDILDSSDKMLDVARQKCIYRNFITTEVKGHNSTPLEKDSYDAVLGVSIICTLQPGITCSAIKEMIRLTKPGGIILMILRTETLYFHLYKDTLLPMFGTLQSEGTWKQIERSQFKYMHGVEGQLFIYQKL